MQAIRDANVSRGWVGLRSLVCLACYCLGLGLASFVLGRCLPFPDVPTVRAKLDWLAKHGDEFDVIVIGSSRVQLQFIPSVFDRAAAESGRPVRSFNAGISAMVPPEDAYVLEQILRRPHRRLRWVVIEIMSFVQHFDPSLAASGRLDYWHDAFRMWLLTKRSAAYFAREYPGRNTSLVARFEFCIDVFSDWSNHLGQFVRRAINYGRGAALLTERMRGGRKQSKFERAGGSGDGWEAPGGPEIMDNIVVAKYERALTEFRDSSRKHLEDAVGEESLRGMISLLRGQGIEPILFIAPTVARAQFYPTHVVETVPLFDFSDPVEHADLFDAKHRRDGVHLNLVGAELFSRELAVRFVQRAKVSSR